MKYNLNKPIKNKEMIEIVRLIIVLVGGFIYFIPTIVGKDKKNVVAILVLNIFLGWTVIGWVGALVWASTKDNSDNLVFDTTQDSSDNEEIETGILTRENAIAKLKEAKDLLDIQIITQDEFNVLKEELSPIIVS